MAPISAHLSEIFIVLGLILLALEVLIFGFSTLVLFFIGTAGIATGLLMTLGLFPETLFNAVLSTAIITAFVASVGWKPMKKMQDHVKPKHVDNDMIGHKFVLTEALAIGQTVTHRYSGIDWQVNAKDSLAAGTEVKIINIEVGLLTVEQVGLSLK